MQTKQDIIDALHQGQIILFPTDTIWGLGCRVDNIDAVKRIFAVKSRDISKPFPVLVSSITMLKEYVEHIHPRIETLLTFHEYPLTVIYPKAKNLVPPSIDKSGSIAIRLVQDDFCADIIEKLGVPIVATSANIGGEAFPQNFSEISEAIKKQVDLIVSYRQEEKTKGKPSIIAKYDKQGNLEFLRT